MSISVEKTKNWSKIKILEYNKHSSKALFNIHLSLTISLMDVIILLPIQGKRVCTHFNKELSKWNNWGFESSQLILTVHFATIHINASTSLSYFSQLFTYTLYNL